MTAQLVPGIAQFFVPDEFGVEAYRRGNHPKTQTCRQCTASVHELSTIRRSELCSDRQWVKLDHPGSGQVVSFKLVRREKTHFCVHLLIIRKLFQALLGRDVCLLFCALFLSCFNDIPHLSPPFFMYITQYSCLAYTYRLTAEGGSNQVSFSSERLVSKIGKSSVPCWPDDQPRPY